VAWIKAIMFNPGDMRMLTVKLFFVMKGAYEVLDVGDFWVTMLNECTNVLLLIGESSLSLVFGSCDMLRGNSMYAAWVMSGHGGVAVNMDANASFVA
jgi:hypothetical protein